MKGFIFSSEVKHKEPPEKDEMIFYGALEDGRSFSWIETNPYNIAFTKEEQSLPRRFFYRQVKGFRDYLGNKLTTNLCLRQREILDYARQNPTMTLLEASIAATTQFLSAKNIMGGVEFLQKPTIENHAGVEVAVFRDSEVKPIGFLPNLRVLSFDIEIGSEQDLLYSIALYSKGYEKVIVLDDYDREEDRVSYVSSERKLLEKFFLEVHHFDPHVITGWYIAGFDLRYLFSKSKQLGIPFLLGTLGVEGKMFTSSRGREDIVHIPGRVIIDGLDVASQLMEDKSENMKLETVSHHLLGKGKSISKDGKEKVDEINRMFYHDKKALAHYNLLDAKLAYDIVEKLGGVRYYQYGSAYSLTPIDRMGSYQEIFNSVYLKKLHGLKIAAFYEQVSQQNLKGSQYDRKWEGGFHNVVAVFSFREFFAFVIVLYSIDPLGMVSVLSDTKQSLVSPKGFTFHKNLSLMREIIFNFCAARRKKMDGVLDKKWSKDDYFKSDDFLEIKAIDRQLNVVVRALLQNDCSFSIPGIKNAIKENAIYLIEKLCSSIENKKLGQVLFFDCERVVIKFPVAKDFSVNSLKEAEAQCEKIIEFVKNEALLWHDKADYFSLLSLDKVYQSFFLNDHHVTSLDPMSLRFDGFDFDNRYHGFSLTRNTLPLVRRFQKELQCCFFEKKNLRDYVAQFKKSLFSGAYDQELFFKKKITKDLDEYPDEKARPDYIKAALQIRDKIEEQKKSGMRKPTVEYYVADDGPRASFEKRTISVRPNYDWYLEYMVAPAAARILKHTSERDLVYFVENKDRQLDLFSS